MDVLDLGSVSNGDDPDDGEEETRHWLSGLVRADVLAISGAGLIVIVVLGASGLGDTLTSYLFMGRGLSSGWVYGPQLASSAVAVVLGLAAVRQAAVDESPRWVRAVGGSWRISRSGSCSRRRLRNVALGR